MRKAGGTSLHCQLDDGGPFLIWQDEEQAKPGRGMVLWTMICDNPECKCRQVQIRAMAVDDRFKRMRVKGDDFMFSIPQEEVAGLPIPEKRLFAAVDVDTEEVSLSQGASEGEQDLELLGLLKEKMKGNLLDTVRRRWRAVEKNRDPDQWRRQDWSWWEPGLLVSWAEAFPDDLNFLIEHRQAVFWANDMYCLSPGCPCETLLIAFYQVDGKGNLQEVGTVAVDLGKWQVEEVHPKMGDQKKLRLLWKLLQKKPDLKETIRKRRRELRTIGREISRMGSKEEAQEPLSRPRVGRNDPCPCGSGKKYKKCCLDKQQ